MSVVCTDGWTKFIQVKCQSDKSHVIVRVEELRWDPDAVFSGEKGLLTKEQLNIKKHRKAWRGTRSPKKT